MEIETKTNFIKKCFLITQNYLTFFKTKGEFIN